MGVYDGDFLSTWLDPIMGDLGVRTFADLKITTADDPGMSLPPSRRYRLVVHTSDITRGQLARLPWDYDFYGQNRDEQDVVAAVRASMSIPFFFEPVTFTTRPADVDVPSPGGGSTRAHYDGGTVTWVDGACCATSPSTPSSGRTAARRAGRPSASSSPRCRRSSPPRRPPGPPTWRRVGCLHTMMNEWDAYGVDAATAGRTIFVDNAGISTTDFDLDPAERNELFLNGVRAATTFVIEMGARGRVPRTEDEARLLFRERRTPVGG